MKKKASPDRVVAICASFASPQAGKLSHSDAPPSKTELAALDFGFVKDGSTAVSLRGR